MKTRLLIIVVFALIPFVFINVYASCDKQVGHADESCTPDELLEICHTLWSPRYDGSATPGNIFCRAVFDLDLNEDDVEKLGIYLDWNNYAMESAKEFVDDWGFYQDHAIPDTLQIHPSVSMRDSLPPAMKVQISFDYVDESEIKTFDESLRIYTKYTPEIIPLPENTWVIMPPYHEPYPEPKTMPNEKFPSGAIVDCIGGFHFNGTACVPDDLLEISYGHQWFLKIILIITILIVMIVGIIVGVKVWRRRK